jgi:hypothetical protein
MPLVSPQLILEIAQAGHQRCSLSCTASCTAFWQSSLAIFHHVRADVKYPRILALATGELSGLFDEPRGRVCWGALGCICLLIPADCPRYSGIIITFIIIFLSNQPSPAEEPHVSHCDPLHPSKSHQFYTCCVLSVVFCVLCAVCCVLCAVCCVLYCMCVMCAVCCMLCAV